MNFALVLAGLLANNFMCVDATSQSEPQCYIRFDYDFKVVEKLVMLETSYKALKSEMEGLKSVTIRKEGNVIYLFVCLFIYLFIYLTYIRTYAQISLRNLFRFFTWRNLDSQECKVS